MKILDTAFNAAANVFSRVRAGKQAEGSFPEADPATVARLHETRTAQQERDARGIVAQPGVPLWASEAAAARRVREAAIRHAHD